MAGQSTIRSQIKHRTFKHPDTRFSGPPGDICDTPNSCEQPYGAIGAPSTKLHSTNHPGAELPDPKMSDSDIHFLMRTGLVSVTPERLKRSLLSALNRMTFPAGHRIISQGKEGDRLFILQHGSCEVNLEKNEELHVVGHLKPGDVFGELAVITGDCRSANVDSLTEVVVWSLEKERFEQIVQSCMELTEFLTDLATERLCSRKITAEKNIGRYRITDVLAEGGWSIVYKGFHSLLNLPVAVKMLKHSMALDSDFFQTFQKEAKTIAALNHDNIVRVYDIEQSYRTVFIIMEYLSGITLREVIDCGHRITLKRITGLLTQVCRGLQYAHHQGVVHQDVKPGNIFIQEGDKAKIVDFGLATPIGGCSDDMPGSPHYMAPEQIEGDPVDARTDIYSLGITAYEMATGVRPYPDDICQVLEYHMTKNTPDPRELNPELPERFSSFIRKSTEKNPDSRFQDIVEVLRELELMSGERDALLDAGLDEGRKRRSLQICYNGEDESGVQRLLDEFCEKLKNHGVELKLS